MITRISTKTNIRGKKDFKYLKWFCEDVDVGDVFVLREAVNPGKNEWKIIAVGKVVTPYRYEGIFSNVDVKDWDVQHCRRVSWKKVGVIRGGGIAGRITPIRNKKAEFVEVAKNYI